MTENADQITYWNDVAGPKWVANQTRLDRLMAPLTGALLEGAHVTTGDHVVDVGCGCGDLALRLADASGPSGRVLAIDISEPMLSHARARIRTSASHAPIAWCREDAMTHRFEPVHDLVVSRFGVMFFDDRERAFANLRRALKPGGRFAVLTWRGRAEVEWMQAPLDWLAPLAPMPDNADGRVGPFAFADAVATCNQLSAAGFRDVTCDPIDRRLTIGDDVADAFSLLRVAGPAAALLRDIEPQLRHRAEDSLRASLQKHFAENRVEMAGACWLYRGRA